jgi:CDP-glucose 4,6-dehydratase
MERCLGSDTTFEKTVKWYKSYYENEIILTAQDLEDYIKDAKEKKY